MTVHPGTFCCKNRKHEYNKCSHEALKSIYTYVVLRNPPHTKLKLLKQTKNRIR